MKRGGREEVRKRWRMTLNSGSRSANVLGKSCAHTHTHIKHRGTQKPKAARRTLTEMS